MTRDFGPEHRSRMAIFSEAGLYLVTSSEMSAGRSTLDIVRMALDAGVRLVQLREKTLSDRALLALALEARALTTGTGALLILNDRVDLALACGADGVHLGQDDLPVEQARALGPDLVIGVSTHNPAEAKAAESGGASYVNIGPLFATQTKKWDEDFLGLDGLRDISRGVSIPFTVMGGIKEQHLSDLVEAGARTIAVVTAVSAAEDPRQAARHLLDRIKTERSRPPL